MVKHITTEELQAGLVQVGKSPKDHGRVEMIVARPGVEERLTPDHAEFDVSEGLVGDNWGTLGSNVTSDGSAHPDMQIAIINSRFVDLIAGGREGWALAGDQLVLDLDLRHQNLQPGQQLAIGSTVLEITDVPHQGCKKFAQRFGQDVIRFVVSDEGMGWRSRGIYAKVVQPGTISVGDSVRKL
jgi:hypothetical protein